jgi:hypothetical protein
MHIMGSPVQDIPDRMGMTPKGVRHSISISEGIVNGVRDEAIPSAPTTPSPKKEIAQWRRRVDALLRKRDREGNPVVKSARDMQRALLEAVAVGGGPGCCFLHRKSTGGLERLWWGPMKVGTMVCKPLLVFF